VSEQVPNARTAAPVLLSYRPWRGQLLGPGHGTWAIARVALLMLIRRRLFWALFGLGAMIFLFFFYGQYLQIWMSKQLTDDITLGPGAFDLTLNPKELTETLKTALHLDGSGYTYRSFIWYEGYIVMIVLALAGAILVGNDFRFGSLPFYLSKPLHRWHYLLGKFLAVGIFVNVFTTIPCLLLYVQYGMIDSWTYYYERIGLVVGIIGYGLALTIVLGLMLLATASWLKRTVPMIMVWTAMFVFSRLLANGLARFHPRWRLLDLWNDLYLVGNWCLWMPANTIRPGPQPSYTEAAIVLIVICVFCLIYLNRRIQAVEIVN
jgi:ABC-type transport system involved in multi-copper enzyme maturation permease subunit